MPVFTRKNLLVASATFAANDGTTTQPSAVVLYVNYRNNSGVQTTDQISMTYNSTTNEWVGDWDSSRAEQGTVEWMIAGSGTLQAATQGQFQIQANAANKA